MMEAILKALALGDRGLGSSIGSGQVSPLPVLHYNTHQHQRCTVIHIPTDTTVDQGPVLPSDDLDTHPRWKIIQTCGYEALAEGTVGRKMGEDNFRFKNDENVSIGELVASVKLSRTSLFLPPRTGWRVTRAMRDER